MIDTMITGFIIMVSSYLFNAGNKVFNSVDPFSWYGSWINVKRRSKIKIAGKKLQGADSTRLHYSTNFFAVQDQDCREKAAGGGQHEAALLHQLLRGPLPDQEAELHGGEHHRAERGAGGG